MLIHGPIKPERIHEMRVSAILKKLRQCGIRTSLSRFRAQLPNYLSASEIGEQWLKTCSLAEWDLRRDFVFYAPFVLWKKLRPHRMGLHTIDARIHYGYDLFQEGKLMQAGMLWWNCWENLKIMLLDHQISDWETLEEHEPSFFGWQHWQQDLSRLLFVLAEKDLCFHQWRLHLNLEVRTLITENHDTEEVWLAIIESYLALGDERKAEQAVNQFNHLFPDSAWGYISWADMYGIAHQPNYKLRFNAQKAYEIYQLVLQKMDQFEEIGIEIIVANRIQTLVE